LFSYSTTTARLFQLTVLNRRCGLFLSTSNKQILNNSAAKKSTNKQLMKIK